jgi:beta-glucosidase
MRSFYTLIIIGIVHVAACAQNENPPGYLDPCLSFEQRAADLVSRMTLEEKVAQMNSFTPAIERLGVPAFHYNNEALHGISEAPGGVLARATSFPQSIAMGSTWNPVLMQEVFTAVSDERLHHRGRN